MKQKNIIILIIVLLVALIFVSYINSNQVIDNSWESDDIQLLRHEIDGTYGCFGCSGPGKDPAMCIDPIMEMKPVEETSERYCNSDFEVIEK